MHGRRPGWLSNLRLGVVVISAVVMAGCDATERTAPPPQVLGATLSDPSITTLTTVPTRQLLEVRSGYTTAENSTVRYPAGPLPASRLQSSFGTRITTAGAIITNPDVDEAAVDVSVLFSLQGTDGSVIDTAITEVVHIAPGATAVVVAPFAESSGEPAALEVATSPTFLADTGGGGGWELLSARLQAGPSGTELRGQVRNLGSVDVSEARWDCVLLAGERIVGGLWGTMAGPIAPGATVDFFSSLPAETPADQVVCSAGP